MQKNNIHRFTILLFLAILVLWSGVQADEGAKSVPAPGSDTYLESIPKFSVEPRIPVLEEGDFYPCSDCHDPEVQKPNPKIRELVDEHSTLELKHGNGRFWCLTCHSQFNRDTLQGLKDQEVSFNESYIVCGQCHFLQQEGLFWGAHGKRVGRWQGERVLMTCVECHNPHDPVIQPAKPFAAPKARRGLALPTVKGHGEEPVWERGTGHAESVSESADGSAHTAKPQAQEATDH